MNPSQPQTVLFVTSGVAHEPSRVFPHGTPVAPFSVGTQGDWAVLASGVEPVQLYIGFDGRELHVAAATQSSRIFLDGVELAAGWQNLRLGSELRFGSACFMASGEAQRPITQPFGRVNEPTNLGQPLRTQFIERPLPLVQPAGPGQSEPPPAQAERAPVLGFVPVQAAPHVQGAQGWQAAQPVAAGPGHPFESTAKWHTPSGAAASSGQQPAPAHPHATQVMSAQAVPVQPLHGQPLHGEPKLKPSPSVALGVPQHAQEPSPAQPPPAIGSAAQAPLGIPDVGPAPGAARFPGPGLGYEAPSGPSTIADGGALRDHAARVAAATPSIAFRSAQAYAAEVRRASGSTPAPGGQATAPDQAPPIASPGWPGNAAPQGPAAPQAFVPDAEPAPKKPSALVQSWREASLVKKITVALLPLGLAGVALMPDEPAPAPVASKRAATARAATSASAGASPSALAKAAAGGASAVTASPSASASPSAAASGPVVALGAPSSGAVSIEIPSTRPSASAGAPAVRGLSATSERDALNAAFEGRNAEAARIYERIAKARGEKAFALAAHLVREDIVLKPAISH